MRERVDPTISFVVITVQEVHEVRKGVLSRLHGPVLLLIVARLRHLARGSAVSHPIALPGHSARCGAVRQRSRECKLLGPSAICRNIRAVCHMSKYPRRLPPKSPPNPIFALLEEYWGLPGTLPAEHATRRADLEK